MPRLLQVTTVPDTLHAFLLPYAEHFRARGWRVDAMAQGVTSKPECVRAFDRVWDVPWSRNPLDPRNLLTAPAMIRAIVEREGYDLVHVHTPIAAFVTRFALKQLRLQDRPRVIYTAHGFHFYHGGPCLPGALYRTLERMAGRWTDYLVVINREDEEAAQRLGIVATERIRYMPGIGVDTARFSGAHVTETETQCLRSEFGLKPGDRYFLMIAEFNKRKRHRDALHAFARLGRRDTHLVFAGYGPLTEPMKQLAAKLNVADRVHFVGFRRDVPALIKGSTAMLLPSEQEGLPRSVMESMCQGVPVIGSRIRGMTDLLGNGRGLLVNVGDAAGIADAMAFVLDRPFEAKVLGENARSAIGTYDLRTVVEMHEELYEEALAASDRTKATSSRRPSLAL